MVSKGDFDPKYFNYGDAYDNLWSAGCHDPDEIYEYRTYGGLDSFLGEYGFRVKDFYKEPSGPASREEDESGSNEGCFLSSACVHARNLPDDCEELTVLRSFRDSYVKMLPGGMEEVELYYRSAPAVVRQILRSDDPEMQWERIYNELVQPCVEDIKSRRYDEAYLRYKQFFLSLEDALETM